MRTNLRTGKTGKEVEMAWLKTVAAFMNSDGGTLLIGVNDQGEITGIEADQSQDDDKCGLHFKNVFNQHIGAEFSEYVDFQIRSVDGRKVVLVTCERSPKPVFLKKKHEEEFYIRSRSIKRKAGHESDSPVPGWKEIAGSREPSPTLCLPVEQHEICSSR